MTTITAAIAAIATAADFKFCLTTITSFLYQLL